MNIKEELTRNKKNKLKILNKKKIDYLNVNKKLFI